MSGFKFNDQALNALVQRRITPHIKKKADQITLLAQHEAHGISRRLMDFSKIQEFVDDESQADGSVVIKVNPSKDRNKKIDAKSFTERLEEKAALEGNDSWMKRAIRKHGYFKPARS